jgi:hypothetical protein
MAMNDEEDSGSCGRKRDEGGREEGGGKRGEGGRRRDEKSGNGGLRFRRKLEKH